jgi:PemK-like, MazF-like toxin of type II toxin-antitoxin system
MLRANLVREIQALPFQEQFEMLEHLARSLRQQSQVQAASGAASSILNWPHSAPWMARNSMRRGEIWTINLSPTLGAEMQKTRPAVIVNDDEVGILPLKVIVPITDWKDR